MTSTSSKLLSALKYSNIILTGLILAYPRRFFQLISSTCKRPARAATAAAAAAVSAATSNIEDHLIEDLNECCSKEERDVTVRFKLACKIVRREQSVSVPDSLQLYGLFKQATLGGCELPKPSPLQFEAMKKYEAWVRFKELSKVDAMKLYIEYVMHVMPRHAETLAKQIEELDQRQDESDDEVSEKDLFETSSEEEEEGSDEDEQQRRRTIAKQKVKDNNNDKGENTRGFGLTVSKMQTNIGSEFLSEREAAQTSRQVLEFFSLIDDENMEAMLSTFREGFDLAGSRNEAGQTALHYAIEKDKSEIFEQILELVDDVNIPDSDGFTPLHVAVLNENLQAIQALLDKGADPSIIDNDGESSYGIANSAIKELFDAHRKTAAKLTVE